MNIHYRYSKICRVNFYKVVYAILTLFVINIAMLVNVFFFATATVVQWRTKNVAKWRKIRGVGVEPHPPTGFHGFNIKNTHLRTLFIEKGRTVPAVWAVLIETAKIF